MDKVGSNRIRPTECWASSLGDCGGGSSREHIVSDSILQFFASVRVHGLPWCQEPKDIGAGSLTAKHLCRDHNARLSPSDNAAFTLFREFRDRFDSGASGCEMPIEISGSSLECWFIKTGINLCLVGDRPLQWPSTYGDQSVPAALVEAAFGVKRFDKPCGLYFYAQHGYKMDSFDGVLFSTLSEQDDRIFGFQYVFRGHPMLLWIDNSTIGNCVFPDGLVASGFQYRTESINLTRAGKPFRSLSLRWS